MSGICGFTNLDGRPADPRQLARMTAILERRGPDRTGHWRSGSLALGHTLLTTTPEAAFEKLPLTHSETGVTITADVRLDNRGELLAGLDIAKPPEKTGDGEIILHAYLKWGRECLDRLLGDFAFAIWDPRAGQLFCARDQMGMRQLIYHHSPGKLFAFATEADAVVALEGVPRRINEERIAEYLLHNYLDGMQIVSTFFLDVFRLPPAHCLTVTPHDLKISRYWRLEPGPVIRLSSDREYGEAMREKLEQAVRCRLRSNGPVGLLMSGGLDSCSVAAVASRLLHETGKGPLHTFSGIGPDPSTCRETRFILEAARMPRIEPHFANWASMDGVMAQLDESYRSLKEPFDYKGIMAQILYGKAQEEGVRVMMDGAASDSVFGPESLSLRLVRKGRFLAATKLMIEEWNYYRRVYSLPRHVMRSYVAALLPVPVKQLARKFNNRRICERQIRHMGIRSDFAGRTDVKGRFDARANMPGDGFRTDHRIDATRSITHNFLVIGRESIDRFASGYAIEQRDPYLDIRLAAFSAALPLEQKQGGGWPKLILRHAMDGLLTDSIRWRRGRDHVGWQFTEQYVNSRKSIIVTEIQKSRDVLGKYIDTDSSFWRNLAERESLNDVNEMTRGLMYWSLAIWLGKALKSDSGLIESVKDDS